MKRLIPLFAMNPRNMPSYSATFFMDTVSNAAGSNVILLSSSGKGIVVVDPER